MLSENNNHYGTIYPIEENVPLPRIKREVPHPPKTKYCIICNEHLPIYLFAGTSPSDGKRSICRGCTRNRYKDIKHSPKKAHNWDLITRPRIRAAYLKRFYNLTPQEFDAILENQHYACASCHSLFGNKSPHVDHDHKTGLVRGLLCSHCNTGLGCFKDNPELLKAAASYLERHRNSLLPVVV